MHSAPKRQDFHGFEGVSCQNGVRLCIVARHQVGQRAQGGGLDGGGGLGLLKRQVGGVLRIFMDFWMFWGCQMWSKWVLLWEMPSVPCVFYCQQVTCCKSSTSRGQIPASMTTWMLALGPSEMYDKHHLGAAGGAKPMIDGCLGGLSPSPSLFLPRGSKRAVAIPERDGASEK